MSTLFQKKNELAKRIQQKVKLHKKVRENKDFCDVVMPSENSERLEFNQYQKYNKAPFIIYEDFECLIEKTDGCKNNPENQFTTKVGKHILSGFPMLPIWSFKSIENKHDIYRGQDCMKKFYKYLREHAKEIINLKKKNWSY